MSIDFTDDNSLMCITFNYVETWIYTINSGTFSVNQKTTDLTSAYRCDFTADGKYLLEVGNPTVNVYEDLDGDKTFALFQSLSIVGSSSSR